LLLVGIELAIHVGTQERIVVTMHVCQLQKKGCVWSRGHPDQAWGDRMRALAR